MLMKKKMSSVSEPRSACHRVTRSAGVAPAIELNAGEVVLAVVESAAVAGLHVGLAAHVAEEGALAHLRHF